MSDYSTDETDVESSGGTEDGGAGSSAEGTGGRFRRRNFLRGLALTGSVGAAGSGAVVDRALARGSASGWEMAEPQLYTPWTEEVGPDNARPEYPRPQMVRDAWKNLNGVWEFAAADEGEDPPIGETLDERVLVPYPIESGLSGIKRHEVRMWYRREFEVPNEWLVPTAHPGKGVENNPNSRRLLLHFERVDWESTVYINGEEATRHRGGYDHFVADVTEHLTPGGPQELVLGVYDPTGFSTGPYEQQPMGRQGVTDGPMGLWKSPASGVWDTVWLEPVPETHVERLDMTPDLDADALRLTASTNRGTDATVVATAYDGDKRVGRVRGPANEELELSVPDPRLWSPDDPHLYDLEVELRRGRGESGDRKGGQGRGGKPLDTVESYFGMRSLGIRTVEGTARPTLNGELVYHVGSLDSGYWPDGIYTAPTDEAQRYHLRAQKRLGYNMVRMHSKFETRRFYAHTDRIGLFVWQDIPNMDGYAPDRDREALEHFKAEARDMITQNDTHPSIAVWTTFNEGWGIDDVDYVEEVASMVTELDPERYVDPDSGYNLGSMPDSGAGHVNDIHQYPGPDAPVPESDRFSANGEYTTPVLHFPDHTVGECSSDITPEEFVDEYVESVEQLRDFEIGQGLSASVYTATTDLKGVCNGQITYDREVIKANRAENGLADVRAAHERLRGVMGRLVVDVDAPDTYATGGGSNAFRVDVGIANPTSSDGTGLEDVSATLSGELPSGWTRTAVTPTDVGSLSDGESATVAWEVTPDATADGAVDLQVAVEYAVDGEDRRYDERVTVSAARLAYWRFEDGPEDSSSFDNSLALRNGAGFTDGTAAEGTYSLRLDGEDDYALISGQGGDGPLHDRFDRRTVSAWVAPDTTAGDQVIYNEGGYSNGFALRISDGSLDAVAANNGTLASVSAPFEADGWTHVAAVFDRGTLRLYLDGEEAAVTRDAGFAVVPSHVGGSELGGNTTTTPWAYESEDKFFGGHIDATAVYRRALSPTDIEKLIARSFAVDAPAFYAAGDDDGTFRVEATFSDLPGGGAPFGNLSMSLARLPDGWTATALTATEFGSVADGEAATAAWEVTPAPATEGAVELEAAVEYEADGASRRLVDGTALNTLESAALARWRFNGTPEDDSGNGHDAALVNGASFDDSVAVEGSHSVALDGEDDYVDLADGGTPYISGAYGERTVSTWIDPDTTAGSQVLFNAGATVNGLGVRLHDGRIEARAIRDGSGTTVAAPFEAEGWTHVGVVFDNGALRLYVDGEEVAADPDVGFAAVGSAYWGGEIGGAERFPWSGTLDGHVDVTAVYPLALSSDLVATLAGRY